MSKTGPCLHACVAYLVPHLPAQGHLPDLAQVRCVDGPVLGTQEVPIGLEHLYYYPKFALVPVRLCRMYCLVVLHVCLQLHGVLLVLLRHRLYCCLAMRGTWLCSHAS